MRKKAYNGTAPNYLIKPQKEDIWWIDREEINFIACLQWYMSMPIFGIPRSINRIYVILLDINEKILIRKCNQYALNVLQRLVFINIRWNYNNNILKIFLYYSFISVIVSFWVQIIEFVMSEKLSFVSVWSSNKIY